MAEVVKVLTVNVSAGTNITGFVPYQGLDFLSEQVQVIYSGLNMNKGLTTGPDVDVYPGDNPNSGDIKFTRNLVAGEMVRMMTQTSFTYLACLVAPQYAVNTKHLEVFAWGERNGQRISNPVSATLKLYLDGTLIRDYGSITVFDARGVCKFEETNRTLVKNRNYVMELSMIFDVGEDPVVSNRTFVNY